MAHEMAVRQIGRFADVAIREHVCTFGPDDAPFEERHARHTIGLVYQGTFQYRTGGHVVTMTPGSAMLGNAGEAFTCSHEYGRGDRCVALSFGPETFEDVAREAGIRLRGFRHPTGAAQARRYAVAASLLGGGDPLLPSAEEIVRLLAADVLRDQSDRPLPPARVTWAERRRAVAACELIDRHADGPLPLATLAAHAGTSPFHFLRSFKRAVGLTPHQFLVQTRLGRAAALLLDTAAAVTTIAYDAGFADLANFNRAFRRTFSCSPRQLRRGRLHALAGRSGRLALDRSGAA